MENLTERVSLIARYKRELLFLSIWYIVVGIALIVLTSIPNGIDLSQICLTFGVVLMVIGVIAIVVYFIRKSYFENGRSGFVLGAIALTLGTYAALGNGEFARILSILLSICVAVDCVFKMQSSIELLRSGGKSWFVLTLIPLIILAGAIVVLINPFGDDTTTRDIFTYITIIIDGLVNICYVLYFTRTSKAK